MAVSHPMRQLLQLLQLEEEQRREALEAALGELRRLERARALAAERERRGRRLVVASAGSGDGTDRLAGLEETRAGARRCAALMPRIAAAEVEVEARREEFLAKRVERRQAETLVEETEAREARESERRGQQALDDWYLNRRRRDGAGEQTPGGSGQAD